MKIDTKWRLDMQIRLASPKDAEAVLAIYAPYCSTPISFELEPPTLTEMERRMRETLTRYPWLLAIDGERVLGYAYGHAFRDRAAYRWSVETSVYVAQGAHQKGIGSALYQQLLLMLKAQGFVSAMAGATLPNPASVRLHKKFGFKEVGECKNVGYKCNAWHDVGFFELELNPPTLAPNEPLALEAVSGMVANATEDSVSCASLPLSQ
jgi:phosphinothricin acetyltransferase